MLGGVSTEMRTMQRSGQKRGSRDGAAIVRQHHLPRSVPRKRHRLSIIALLLCFGLLPLQIIQPAMAQDQSPPIAPVDDGSGVGVVDNNPVAVVDGQSVDTASDSSVAPSDDGSSAPAVDQTTTIDDSAAVPADDPSATINDSAQVNAQAPPSAMAAQVTAAVPDVNWSPPQTVYIPETGQTIDGVFLDLWRNWGGATGFGDPITPELQENGHIVQYFGYARLEYWPEDPNGNIVHFGDIGDAMRPFIIRRGAPGNGPAVTEAARAALAWLPLTTKEIKTDSDSYRYIAATKHSVSGDIKSFWQTGGQADFLGNPLTEPYVAGGNTYQVFERGKVVQEPGGYPYLLPAGELAAARDALNTAPIAQNGVPTYSEELFIPPPPPPPPAPAASGATPDPNGEKWVQVSLGQQYATAWQGDTVVWQGYVSTGREGFETPTGTFHILTKLESQTMEGVIGGEYYNVPNVPWVMYFTDLGHALHGTYWHNNFGTPMSHGCVNLPMDVAEWMYQWAPVGTRVEIDP